MQKSAFKREVPAEWLLILAVIAILAFFDSCEIHVEINQKPASEQERK